MLTEALAGAVHRLAVAALLLSAFGLSGCALPYLLQAGHGQWRLLRARTPVDGLIADPSTDAALRARLELAREARAFASRALGLPDNRSYRSYSALGRDYVVWNVVAAPEFSVMPKRWWFPITGSIAYRGYFREASARRYAAALAARGYDTYVGGVSAYSTLGRFADPLIDTMLRYGDLQLAGTIFHELAHQLVYVPGDSEFNEAFAMSVERAGVARWLESRGRSAELAGYRQRMLQQAALQHILASGRAQLAGLYASALPAAAMRARKQALLAATVAAARDYESRAGLRTGYDAWFDAGLNNAHLASVATYFDCVPGFERLLAAQGGDLPAYYRKVRALARGPAAARRALCAAPGGVS
ncbi:MAG: aminopeptidase [Gammaproteobacteria bacterium]|nr:aminopeptidase [Gammaproteobacteria bacterium]MDE2251666.1 aminopeptidase [Gammaproteobacteria bacterium]